VPIGKDVKRWESIIRGELERSKIPLPVKLVLSVIDVESRGKPGLVNPKSGASGLMQVMPVVVRDFNKHHSMKYTMADMRDPQNPLAQIRVGVWILGQFWKGAYRYLLSRLPTVPMDELMRIADLFYVAGPGATRKKLDKLSTPTFSAIAERWPKWNALPHTIRVQNRVSESETKFDLAAISNWLSNGKKGSLDDPLTKKQGAAIALIILALAYLLFFRKR
jgi:hypothetical protein